MIRVRKVGGGIASSRSFLMIFITASIMWVGSHYASAAVTTLNSPAELTNVTAITFDGYSDYTIADTLFQSQGVTFTRDDGVIIYLSDWTALGRSTTSPDNVLATVGNVWATHLNVIPRTPIFAMGAYFGNDQADPDFTSIRMSAYGLTGAFLGSVQVTANSNTEVDQFIGLRSDVPISRVRFDNPNAAGTQSSGYSVVIDDLMFVLAVHAAKEKVLAELITLRAAMTNQYDARKLDQAIKHLTKSVAATLWVDEIHLERKHGGRVFYQEGLTVRTLCHWMNSGRSHISGAVLQGFIDRIFQADRMLTVVAIQDAITAEVSSTRIEQAQRFLTNGDAGTRDNRCANGIEDYKNAWKRATR